MSSNRRVRSTSTTLHFSPPTTHFTHTGSRCSHISPWPLPFDSFTLLSSRSATCCRCPVVCCSVVVSATAAAMSSTANGPSAAIKAATADNSQVGVGAGGAATAVQGGEEFQRYLEKSGVIDALTKGNTAATHLSLTAHSLHSALPSTHCLSASLSGSGCVSAGWAVRVI